MAVTEQWLVRLPRAGEICVFSQTPAAWRRDALMFDRVYAPLDGPTGLSLERDPKRLSAPNIPIEFSFADDVADQRNRRARGEYSHWLDAVGSGDLNNPDFLANFEVERMDYEYRIRADRELEQGYRDRGVMGTWCANENGLFFERFSKGETDAYQGALNNLPIVSADIGWDEVRSFREDRGAVRKYRDLRLWLADGLASESEQQATDLIAQRIEDYRWAIRKHGLETVTGVLANLWDWRQSMALVAGVGAAATTGSAAIAALVAGLSVTSGVGAYFAKRRLSREDVGRGPGREVAILVDIQNRFGGLS